MHSGEVAVERTIATLKLILAQLAIFKYEVTDIVRCIGCESLMNGSQLTATSIIDILCLETIVEGNAAEVVQHIILNLADALAKVI